ncbi:MAG: hypothetical protein K0S61_4934, partial [Anaerocolumna sp.]|nr:hypothetical protein [Anaerocolumna sp.]
FIKQSGPDFLLKENAASLKRKAMMFFRDVAYGSFEMDKHGQYLSDEKLISIMVNEARIKMVYYNTHCSAINIMIQTNPSSNTHEVQTIARQDYDSLIAYSIMFNGLSAVLYSKNLSTFDVIANQIKAVKYSL